MVAPYQQAHCWMLDDMAKTRYDQQMSRSSSVHWIFKCSNFVSSGSLWAGILLSYVAGTRNNFAFVFLIGVYLLVGDAPDEHKMAQ